MFSTPKCGFSLIAFLLLGLSRAHDDVGVVQVNVNSDPGQATFGAVLVSSNLTKLTQDCDDVEAMFAECDKYGALDECKTKGDDFAEYAQCLCEQRGCPMSEIIESCQSNSRCHYCTAGDHIEYERLACEARASLREGNKKDKVEAEENAKMSENLLARRQLHHQVSSEDTLEEAVASKTETKDNCVANYGSTKPCCGQTLPAPWEDLAVSTPMQCPAGRPTCVGYVKNVAYGECNARYWR